MMKPRGQSGHRAGVTRRTAQRGQRSLSPLGLSPLETTYPFGLGSPHAGLSRHPDNETPNSSRDLYGPHTRPSGHAHTLDRALNRVDKRAARR
jgi:hypothetical protein